PYKKGAVRRPFCMAEFSTPNPNPAVGKGIWATCYPPPRIGCGHCPLVELMGIEPMSENPSA
ncbi:MAG: hypothetical protein J5885_02860, partial [Clostridia bacterium]|nr:hypothetical protein [Clostridia bacterium]